MVSLYWVAIRIMVIQDTDNVLQDFLYCTFGRRNLKYEKTTCNIFTDYTKLLVQAEHVYVMLCNYSSKEF